MSLFETLFLNLNKEPIDTSRNLWANISAKSSSNISINPSEPKFGNPMTTHKNPSLYLAKYTKLFCGWNPNIFANEEPILNFRTLGQPLPG